MKRTLLIKFSGAAGAALILCGYVFLSTSPDAELQDVIVRTRHGILFTLIGSVMTIYCLFMK